MDYDRLENVGEHLTSTSRRGRHFIRLKREEMIEVSFYLYGLGATETLIGD